MCIVCVLHPFMLCIFLLFYKYLINFSEYYMNKLQKENYIYDVYGGSCMIVWNVFGFKEEFVSKMLMTE